MSTLASPFHRFAAAGLAWLSLAATSRALDAPPVFPLPQEIALTDAALRLDGDTVILLPAQPSHQDLKLARLLQGYLADRTGLAVETAGADTIPAGKHTIIVGSVNNPLVQRQAAARGWTLTATQPGPEGYLLAVDSGAVVVGGCDDAGAFYGVQSLRQLLAPRDNGWLIRGARIKDWPRLPFRGIRLYLPGQENVAFFKRFLRDFMALYKFNRVIIEMNAAMRLDRHPELNAGWRDFAKDLISSRRERPLGPADYFTNSSHHDTGDGGVLEKPDVAEIVAVARQNHIEVIPEIPSLTHSYYLLTRHRELAEIQAAEWPDTYCPADPRSHELIFDVLDEFVEVMKPKIVHIGHDEWRMPTGLCPRCRGLDVRDLLVQDIAKLHGHLAAKGVGTALWGDHLLEAVRGKHLKRQKSPQGYVYDMPGALTPQQVEKLPRDLIVLNWFWSDKDTRKSSEGTPTSGQHLDAQISKWGFRQVWGNLTPELSWQNCAARSRLPGIIGGASSSWAASTEFNFGKDLMWKFLGTQNMLWSNHWPERAELSNLVQSLLPTVRRNLSGVAPPSDEGDPVVPIDLRAGQTAPVTRERVGFDPAALKAGAIEVGRAALHLSQPDASGGQFAVAVSNQGTEPPPFPTASGAIPVGQDVSSLIFLHALAKPAGSQTAYRLIHNFPDAADLLGWYEVTYADG
ncbi:MAG: hypothetical protein FJ399_09185, partial [Verrucomicrobia bacterium]|nr:hypothetical protein [Verrucomicrobiota bacterium]